MNSRFAVLSPLLLFGLLATSSCKTGGVGATGSSPSDVSVSRTLLQTECKGTDSEFNMRFSINGLKNDPDSEAEILVNVINSVNNEKVVNESPGLGFFSSNEYIYLRFAVGGLTLDWQDGQYIGAATVNANPEETAVEVNCTTAVLANLP